jgi:hypothetical protein
MQGQTTGHEGPQRNQNLGVPGFNFRRCQIFCLAVCLERGALNLLRINEELLEGKTKGSGLENSGYRLGEGVTVMKGP